MALPCERELKAEVNGMKKTIFLQDDGAVWLKGNIHSHTTFSDGCLSPEEAKEAYQHHGYDFLIITDHDRYTDTRRLSDEKFTMVQGMELSGFTMNDKRIHINVFWAGDRAGFEPGQTIALASGGETKELCEKLRSRGCYVMLNHPHWSLIQSTDIGDCSPYDAVEIYNYGTDWLERMGDGRVFWTELLLRGCRLWNGGSDDNHNDYEMDSPYCDSFGGFTVVKAEGRSPEAIVKAMKAGSFYTSEGPSIYDFYVEDDTVHVVCSPCVRIYINGERRQYQRVMGQYMTEFVTKLKGTEIFIRAECTDAAGRSAYSNPIYL